MTKLIDIRDLVERLEEIRDMSSSDEIVVTDGSIRVAKLTPLKKDDTKERIPGLHLGAMEPTADFNDPLPDAFWLGEL